jgi:hypothetical protein
MEQKIEFTTDGNPPCSGAFRFPDPEILAKRAESWFDFSDFIKQRDGFIPDPRDCHHQWLFEIYMAGREFKQKL